MKLAAKFLLAFVATSFVVLAASGYVRVVREIEGFDGDMRRDAAAYASSLAHAIGDSATPDKTARFLRRSNDRTRHLQARWVSLGAGAERPLAPAAELEPLRRGHPAFWIRRDARGPSA